MKSLENQLYKQHSPKSIRLIVIFIIAVLIIGWSLIRPLQADVWYDLKELVLLSNLSGRGEYVDFKRNLDTKAPNWPLEVQSDGYKMVRVYQNFPGVYMVEWAWQITIKNISVKEVRIIIEYKLLDQNMFFVASSFAPTRTILPGQTVTIEQKDILPHEKGKQVEISNWNIQLQ